MDDIVVVKVADSLQSLTEESKRFWLSEDCFGVLVIEQVTSLCVLHHHVDFVIFEQRIPEFDEVRMVDLAVELYLPLYEARLRFRGNGADLSR